MYNKKKLIVIDSLIFISIQNVMDKTLVMISKEIKLIVVDSLIFVCIENVMDKNVRYDI